MELPTGLELLAALEYMQRNNKPTNTKGSAMKAKMRKVYEQWGFTVNDRGIVSCDSCQAVRINTILTHETGCQNAKHECAGCNELIPANQKYCAECS